MSTTLPHTVACGRCGHSFRADLYWGLHATRAPEVRAAILAGGFQRFVCPGCGRDVVLEPTLLYTDFDRAQWIGVFPRRALRHHAALGEQTAASFERNMRVAAPPMVRAWAPDFRVRAVFGLPSLREKLLLWDEGTDDGVFECLKMQHLAAQGLGYLDPGTEAWLHAAEPDAWILAVVGPTAAADGAVAELRIRVPRSAYATALAERDVLAATFTDLYAGPVVDWRAALVETEPLPAAPAGPDPYPWAPA